MRRTIGLLAVLAAVPVLATGCGEQRANMAAVRDSAATPSAAALSGATTAFAVVRPGARPDEVLLARATRRQPGGPETVVPANVRPAAATALAPGARIHITAPLFEGDLKDWLKGIQVTPEQFAAMSRTAERRYGPLPDRARMFDVRLDGRQRITVMRQIFSP
ncbi:hypothetical protein ACGFNU_19145 [Spirillospora sp. NPDC048911]|uniref:hypothetical protein n=1 Tax=Spirillospora sp. NPDC048911 TaxID=3364527 RepID=UPI003716725A